MKIRLLLFLFVLCLSWGTTNTLSAQAPKRWTSTELHDALQKLDFLGSALYMAAHPDDENTRLIAYLANVTHANTAYLSLTRGDGGQNLVGPEIRELLGIIRTQELLAARRLDGGYQFFSRANDFGYSKHPDETFNIWDRDQVLADAVWVIRNFQPDVIINRFDHRRAGRTHGHHTASAILSLEAFGLSGDRSAYPEQLAQVDTWQPKRVFYNTSWWRYGSREAFEKVDKSNMVQVDVGTYLPKRGVSVPEIAALSRSQHKSQGFGSSGSRGSQTEYLELVKGEFPSDPADLFAGINTTWSRVEGGAPIGKLTAQLIEDFDFDRPQSILPELLEVRQQILALEDGYWKRVKLAEVEQIIEGVMGLFLEATANDPTAAPGQEITVSLEAINRSDVGVKLIGATFLPQEKLSNQDQALAFNEGHRWEENIKLPTDLPFSNSYWLNEKASLGMYTVKDQLQRGKPETPPKVNVVFHLSVQNAKSGQWTDISLVKPLVYKTTDPVKGEVYQPFEVTPKVFVNLSESAYIYADARSQTIIAKVTAGQDNISGKIELCHPENWSVKPASYEVELPKKGQEATFRFELSPPEDQDEDFIVPLVRIGEESFTNGRTLIEYDHIPTQTVFQDASAKVVRLDIKKEGQYIGYLMGAGDEIPQALEQIGYDVTLLEDRDMSPERLKDFDAVILGIRAYNTIDRMPVYQPMLMDYVKNGGTLLVQYNTNRRMKIPMEELAPYPLNVSRDRVTVEEAEVRILAPDHPVMNEPNKITDKDFDGWVQERGLYFPNEWSEEYTPILSSNDPGEPARDGGLLVAKYGEGHYIYSGYSWFRELPAGVPGAYRLFANLISLGNKAKP